MLWDAFYLCYLRLSSLTEGVGRKNRKKTKQMRRKKEEREGRKRGRERGED